jgi:hypothetical protein
MWPALTVSSPSRLMSHLSTHKQSAVSTGLIFSSLSDCQAHSVEYHTKVCFSLFLLDLKFLKILCWFCWILSYSLLESLIPAKKYIFVMSDFVGFRYTYFVVSDSQLKSEWY